MGRAANLGMLLWGMVFWLTTGPVAAQDQKQSLQNWPRWRGPLATGVAAKGNPPVEWSETKNIRWKVSIPGKGSASPVIWGDKIFLLTAISTEGRTARAAEETNREPVAFQPPQRGERGEDRERGRGRGRLDGGGRPGEGQALQAPYDFVLLCLDRNSGKTLWQKIARTEVPHEVGHNTNTYASASAVTDGKHVYASFGSRGIYCYDLDGNKVWEKDLGEMQTRNAFGEGASPALHGNTLVVPWDHEGEDFVVALDARTGDEKWRRERDEPTTWGTPHVARRGDGWQVILNGHNRVRSYDLETGAPLWECGGQAMNPIPTPVSNDEMAFVMTGFRGYALYAVPLDASGDLTDTDKIAWKRDDGTPYISSPVLSDGLLYITKGRNAILSCLEAETGNEVYVNERLPGMDVLYASPVAAAGRLYYFSREGTGIVVKAGREFEILAENKLDETIDASPAIVGDAMYVRGDASLYCIAE